MWCHKVTELKAGLLTRRLWSTVLCRREELLLVQTLTFKQEHIKHQRKGKFKHISGKIQGSYNTTIFMKVHRQKGEKLQKNLIFYSRAKYINSSTFNDRLCQKLSRPCFFSLKTQHPSRLDLLVDVSNKLETERTQLLLMRLWRGYVLSGIWM